MKLWRFCILGAGIVLMNYAWAGSCQLQSYGTLPVEMVGDKATTLAKVNGVSTRFALDTGAFFSMMPGANASSLGLKLQPAPFGFRVGGVGGSTEVQITHVKEFGILDTTLKNIDFIVGGTDIGFGLLGANLLDLADLEIDLSHGKLTLFKVEHCDKSVLAYWTKDGNYNVADIKSSNNQFDRRTFFDVTINGKKVRAVLDSGASATVLTRSAAERVGLKLDDPDFKASSSFGIGARSVKTWTARVDSFSVGTETIQHSQMQVIDGRIGDGTDMLLGVDFLLAHRMFVANSQRKAYFSYNGGRVFTLATAPSDSDKHGDPGADENDAKPVTASDYALRGEALLSRGEPTAALTDLDEAVRLAPDQSAYYVARAQAHVADKQPDAALADLDKSLSLDPKNISALLMRAEFRVAHKNRVGATADATAAGVLVSAGSAQARTVATLDVQLGQPAAALPLFDGWIRLHKDDARLGSALNERCWARSLTNQMLDDALSDCRRAIKRDGENPAYLDSLGLVELRLGKYPESIKAYEPAVAQNPKSAWSRYGLGLAKIRSGQTDAGNADLVAARALDPEIDRVAAKYGLVASAR